MHINKAISLIYGVNNKNFLEKFQVGNLANDGIKLASGSRKCSAEPQDGLEAEAKGGTLRYVPLHFINIFFMIGMYAVGFRLFFGCLHPRSMKFNIRNHRPSGYNFIDLTNELHLNQEGCLVNICAPAIIKWRFEIWPSALSVSCIKFHLFDGKFGIIQCEADIEMASVI